MKRIYYTNEKNLAGYRWVAKVVDFGVSLEVMSAINEIYSAQSILRAHKTLYRHEAKKYCSNAIKAAKAKVWKIRENMAHENFWLDYADHVIDAANNDVTIFRLAIRQVLDEAKYTDSELISYMECARVLIDVSVKQFDRTMHDARERFGRDYTKDFCEYRLTEVQAQWEKLCDMLYGSGDVDLTTDATMAAFDAMLTKFAEGKYIDECLDEARRNNPDFVENDIVVKE